MSVKRSSYKRKQSSAQELCQSTGQRARLSFFPYPTLPPSPISLMVSVEVEHHERNHVKYSEDRNVS